MGEIPYPPARPLPLHRGTLTLHLGHNLHPPDERLFETTPRVHTPNPNPDPHPTLTR